MRTVLRSLIDLLEKTEHWLSSSDAPLVYEFSLRELAYAVILVDMALVDRNFDAEEHRYIKDRLEELLRLSPDQSYALIEKADLMVRQGGRVDEYAAFLKHSLKSAQREQLIRELDVLLGIDSDRDIFELQLRTRYERLLGVRVKNPTP